MKAQEVYRIDPRSRDDLLKEIAERAASYTPEWLFDPNDPDIGSIIALLFADQTLGSIERLNRVIGKYRTEFVNMMNIGMQPASPAGGIAVFELIHDIIPEAYVPSGTKLLAYNEDTAENVVFETQASLHVTNSMLRDILAVSGSFGKIIPYANDDAPEAAAEIPLFDFSGEGIEQNALMLYHENAFDVQPGTSILIQAMSPDGESLAERLADPGRFCFRYQGADGLAEFSQVWAQDGAVALRCDGPVGHIPAPDGTPCGLIRIDAAGRVADSLDIADVRLSSFADDVPPAFVGHNDSDLPKEAFMPFGETASLFDDCYIGCDPVFVHAGASVTLRFFIEYKDKFVTFAQDEVDKTLKVVKLKPRRIVFDAANTCVERVSIEYFNGSGWRRIEMDDAWGSLFDGACAGDVAIPFACPPDWEPVDAGPYTGRCLRLRVEQADNCYLQPCLHHMPLIRGLSVSYSYHEGRQQPRYVRRVSGTEEMDCTPALRRSEAFTAFRPIDCPQNSLFLGFDNKTPGASMSLFFKIQEKNYSSDASLRFEYSSHKGFVPMRVSDGTAGLSRSGLVMFMPGEDFREADVCGVSRHWIRIVDADGIFDNPDCYHPVIESILPHAAPIHNVYTMNEELFYVDTAAPHMSFALSGDNILSADVFVNERNLPAASIEKLIAEEPERVRVEYDRRGAVSEFYVRWDEAENFDRSLPGDRHYRIDRLANTIHFGDGIGVRIPAAYADPSFSVRIRRCDGSAGNLPEGTVRELMDRILYIGDIRNPIPTSGGSDMESVNLAIERGADVLNSQNRLVSERDFVRETLTFSHMVSRARCVVGVNAMGKEDRSAVSIVVLMRDYAAGPYSFENIHDRLKDRLLARCEATLTADQFHITEPMFVHLDVDVWADTDDVRHRFEIAARMREEIAANLEPLPAPGDGDDAPGGGWQIGEAPTVSQIDILLHGIRREAVIRRFAVTARYIDSDGEHACELAALRVSPFMVCVSGQHRVHFLSNGVS
ncbi:MAG: hypothetical protein LBS91_02335 [Clostridiales Family XIII bacterium]|jgi:hypothetical protein|nr:hypothetical protein [Clostridiales Family XIII bacterium]